MLIARMGKAAEAKKEQAAAARHDLEKFYEERREKIARNQAVNVREQKDFQEEMASVMATGTEWEKVAKVADIAPKGGKSGSRDVDRMRTVMIEVRLFALSPRAIACSPTHSCAHPHSMLLLHLTVHAFSRHITRVESSSPFLLPCMT